MPAFQTCSAVPTTQLCPTEQTQRGRRAWRRAEKALFTKTGRGPDRAHGPKFAAQTLHSWDKAGDTAAKSRGALGLPLPAARHPGSPEPLCASVSSPGRWRQEKHLRCSLPTFAGQEKPAVRALRTHRSSHTCPSTPLAPPSASPGFSPPGRPSPSPACKGLPGNDPTTDSTKRQLNH